MKITDPYWSPVWHDEAQRFERTGRLDQGPCWCDECVATVDTRDVWSAAIDSFQNEGGER